MSDPIAMLMFCPRCSQQHVDLEESMGDFAARMQRKESPRGAPTRWMNPPHATHTCQYCGLLWRPSNANTRGVQVLEVEEPQHLDRILATDPRRHT